MKRRRTAKELEAQRDRLLDALAALAKQDQGGLRCCPKWSETYWQRHAKDCVKETAWRVLLALGEWG